MASGLLYYFVGLLLINKQKESLSPQVLHDAPDGVRPHQARHNKALTTLKFLPFVLGAYVLIATLQFLFSQTKRE